VSRGRLRRRYGHAASAADRARLAERRKLSSYQGKVRDEQRFGKGVREELKAMFFSGGPGGLAMPTGVRMLAEEASSKAGDDAAAFYREHIGEFDELYKHGYGATDAARAIGNKHRVRHFR
jgi:hypothetical protein